MNSTSAPEHRVPRRELRPDEVPPSRFVIFLLVASAGCYVDLLTKRWAFESMGMPNPVKTHVWWLWENFVGIDTSLNRGALFVMGQNGTLWFAGLSFIALFGVITWFVWGRIGRSLSMTLVLGCIAGGILGNLYDRLGLWSLGPDGWPRIHAVRDWIRFSYYDHVWPNFNIADSLLVCSALFLAWQSFRPPLPEHAENPKHSDKVSVLFV